MVKVKWETIIGKKYEGELIRVEDDGDGLIADVKLYNGAIKTVEADALTLVGETE